MTDTPPNDNDGVDGLADRAKEMLDRVKGGTADAADQGDGIADKAKSALSGLTDKAKDAVSGAGDAVDETVDAGAAVISTSGAGGAATATNPYGAGSAAPLADKREMPACHPIKGNVDSMLYHRPDSQNYGATIAEVWFDSPSAAEAAGFTLSPSHPSDSNAADYEPGGSGHPCSVADVDAGRAAVRSAAAAGGAAVAGGASAVAGNLGDVDDVAGDAGAGMADKAADAAGATGAKVAGAAAGVAGGAAAAAGGLADRAKGLMGSAKDKLDGDDTDDAGSGIGGKLAGAAGGAAAAVGGLAGKAKDAAGNAVDSVQDAVGDGVDAVKDTADDGAAAVSASAAGAGAAGAAAAGTVTSTTTTVSGGGAAGGAGGSGSGGGGGGGWFGDDDDDEEKLFADIPLSGTAQIFGLGLLAAAIMIFGSSVWGFFFPGDDAVAGSESIVAAADGPCADVLEELEDSDSVSRDDLSDVRCEFRNGRVILSGDVADLATKTSIGTIAGGATLGGALIANELDFDEPDTDEVEVAAETTTTAAPETTTTTAAPETTTAAPETTEAETTTTEAPTTTAAPFTMWQALNDSGSANQFAIIGASLGLEDDLSALVDADGVEVNRTLFALSDESMALLDIPALAADQAGAAALVGYHFIDQRLSSEDLIARDGQSVITRTGLPMSITVDGDDILLNGNSLVIEADIEADNGIIHIITPALTPPTINEVIDLENIEFEVNSDVITAAGQAELQKAIDFFTENDSVTARIEGHTDTDGNDVSNQDLSERRAISVKAFLVDNGVNGDNLDTIGFGETQPILVDGVEDKAASRRIEFNVR